MQPCPQPVDVHAITTDLRLALPGARLAYGTRGGAGSPVLLVIGLGVPGRAWVHQVPALAARHTVAWFDHRGAGATEAAAGPYSTSLLAADALGLVDHLGWERFHLVGVSMGGMVAQELALAHRARLRSLTLIATHAGGLRARLPPSAGLWRMLQINLAPSSPRRLQELERLLFPPDFSARCDRAWMAAMLRADYGRPASLPHRLSQTTAVLRHDARARLHRLAGLPTLVVRPGQDLLIRPRCSDELARRIPGARLLTLPEAGHGVIRQCYPQLNAALLEHLARADG